MHEVSNPGIVMAPSASQGEGFSLVALATARIDLISLLRSENLYASRNWDREEATRYVFRFGNAIVEASFFSHYRGERHVKNVIELPTSFGCPVGCRHCASALLDSTRQLTLRELAAMVMWIIDHQSLAASDSFLVTFSGIGEGSFQVENLRSVCKAIFRSFPKAFFTLTTVGFNSRFLEFVDQLGSELPVHFLQISYLHYDTGELRRIIPRADVLGFDFRRLVRSISELRNIKVRLNYVVIDSFNDDANHLEILINMLEGLQLKVILRVSALNETEPSRYYGVQPVPSHRLFEVRDRFCKAGFEAYVFGARRNDNMNCGQLAWHYSTGMKRGGLQTPLCTVDNAETEPHPYRGEGPAQ